MSDTTMERPPAPVPAPAPIDPRIRARRIEVQRGAGRKRLQRVVDLGLVLVVAIGFAGALRSPLLDVDAVVVRGNEHTPTDLVLDAAGISQGDQLMDLDLARAGEQVGALPWVAETRLHRGLDGQVALRIIERTAVAVSGDGDRAVLVDATGQALAFLVDEPVLGATLVRLTGIEEHPEPGQVLDPEASGAALELAARLAVVAPGLVPELSVADPIVGVLASGEEVRFGDPTQLEAKVRSLRTVLDQVDLTCAAVIDLRSPGSPVLTREEGCS